MIECMYHEEIKNRGSAVIEALMILPLFIFAMLAVYQMGQCRLAEADIYEAAAETAEYMSEYSYLEECSVMIPKMRFPGYVDDRERIERYIDGGVEGVDFWGTVTLDDDNYIELKVNYVVRLSLPFVPELTAERTISIRQKAYVGDGDKSDSDSGAADDAYVYVTDNREVYHTTRSCSYLKLSISLSAKEAAQKAGYTVCSFCGDNSASSVYITEDGRKYHCSLQCSGLKRTVYRVKLSEVSDLGGCRRCAGY